jgi:hypothetical protein
MKLFQPAMPSPSREEPTIRTALRGHPLGWPAQPGCGLQSLVHLDDTYRVLRSGQMLFLI